MSPELRDRPLFICGHPKSGTSLLRALLDGHPQLVVYPEESVFFRRYLPKAAGKNINQQLELADQYLIHIFAWNQENPPPSQAGFPDRDYSAISFDAVRTEMHGYITANPPRHSGDLLSAAVLAFGQVTSQVSADSKYWVEKSPYNEHETKTIFSWWPQATCVHVVRDPRDNYLSYHRKHPDWAAEFFTKNWIKSTEAGLQNREFHGRDSYLILRYEDLVEFPEKVINQICEFLHIDYQKQLTRPARAGESWAGNSMFDQEFDAINSTPVGRWRAQLSSSDAAVISSLAEKQMHQLNYSFSHQTTLGTRLRIASWPVRRRLTRLSKPRN